MIHDLGAVQIHEGHVIDALRAMPAESVHCVVTSPPYFALRSYLKADDPRKHLELGSEKLHDCGGWATGNKCGSCYICHQVQVFDAVRRVMREDAVLWVNLGDSYAASGVGNFNGGSKLLAGRDLTAHALSATSIDKSKLDGLKPLDRIGIPERFALAMQADGWWWRDSIIWHKPSCMPSSVAGWRWEKCKVKTKAQPSGRYPDNKNGQAIGGWNREQLGGAEYADCPGCAKCSPNSGYVLRRGSWRTTASHEVILMFAKSASYFCDSEAVREPAEEATLSRNQYSRVIDDPNEQYAVAHDHEFVGGTRNPRSVWTIGPEPLKHGHYAAYPSELPERCIRASCSAHGVCGKCGAQWARVERTGYSPEIVADGVRRVDESRRDKNRRLNGKSPEFIDSQACKTLGFRATCKCHAPIARPVVLDPFGGSGRTAMAALRLGCRAILCELNPAYVTIAKQQLGEEMPLLVAGGAA